MAVRWAALVLLACLAVGGAQAALPTLANQGGPSVIEGLSDIAQLDPETSFATVLAVGYVLGGTSNYTFYNPDTMETTVQTGEFKSWQCAPANGTFNAIVELTTTSNGTQTTRTVCMFGEVYLIQQQYSWVQSETSCPSELPVQGYYTATLHSLTRGTTFECGEADGDADGYITTSSDFGSSMNTDPNFGLPSPSF